MRLHASSGSTLGTLGVGLLAALIAGPVVLAAPAQETAAASADTPTFASGTAQVVLDVVVRDKKGRPVLDVRPEEIEVFEQGEQQTVEGFKLVESEGAEVQEKRGPTLTQPDADRRINLVTIVFDALGVDGRRMGKKAAEAFLDKGLKSNTFVSIFRVDQRLSMVAPFTNDKKLLEQAIDRATSGERFGVTDEREAMAAALKQMEGPTGPAAGEGAPDTGGVGENAAAQAQARAIANMLRLANELQAQQQGGTSLYPLLALMKGQKDLAGRKTLIYVTEWLGVPPSLEAVFRSVISEANRSNVSVYAIDARGLQTGQAMAGARAMLDRARNTSMDTMQSGGGGAVSKEEIKLSETAEGALRANVEGILQDLAEGTGGFHVSNTNNFKPGAEQIAADIAGYYELTYTPPPFPFDGTFRTIEVRVARKDVSVHTRNGYFALPPGEASAVFPYEVPLLGALSVDNPPADLTLRAGALRFGKATGGRDTKIVVEVPIADLKMTTDELTAKYNLHLSLLAAVKGPDGDIVQRYSEDYPFEGPIERAEALKMGNIVFKRRLGLPPGEYILEVAGQDRTTGKIAVERDSFVVPKADAGPQMSSIALVRRVDDLPEGTESDDPLDLFNKKRIVPNLDAPISRATNPKLWLFFMAYPEDGAAAPPEMTMEFVKDGKPVGRSQAMLPAPDPDGIIRFIGPIPTDSFPEGTYGLKIALKQGSGACQEETGFTLVP